IFSRLAGPDGRQRMPVIGCGDRYRIDVLGFEHRSHIGVFLGTVIFGFANRGDRALTGSLIDVAHSGNAAVGIESPLVLDVVSPAATQADLTQLNAVVCAENREPRGRNRGGGSLNELASCWRY